MATVSAPPCRSQGPLSAWVTERLERRERTTWPSVVGMDPFGRDLQLALYLAYEVHYASSSTGIDEWDPVLIGFRRRLEAAFENALVELVGPPRPGLAAVEHELPRLIRQDDGPSLSSHMEAHGTPNQMREFVKNRSPYQLKEADPHTFGLPRAQGRAKQYLAQIQAGEYGADGEGRVMHSDLFAQTMRALGLSDTPNVYLDDIRPGGLMVSNLVSLFGMNRRWTSALMGHLAVFEMTSVAGSRRYSSALRRLGFPRSARRFYDVHVDADAEHETIALEMARECASAGHRSAADVLFGARCALAVECRFARELLGAWGVDVTAR